MAAEGVASPPPGSTQCMLGYPDRYEAASKYIRHARAGGKELPPDTLLMLYALGAQVEKGPCNLSKPGGWLGGNAQEVAMWQSWKSLGSMSPFEAMRLYVRTVEEDEPNWYAQLLASKAAGNGSADALSVAAPAPAQWTPVPQAGKKPLPRYEHAAAILGGKLFVVGGNYSGRYLSDVWAMDLATKVWTQLHTRRAGDATQADPGDAPPDAGAAAPAPTAAAEEALCLPPLAGHSITVWKDALILLGGHAKPKDAPPAMPARVLDAAGNVAELALGGPLCPSARGGHSATLIGRRVYVFGGEDAHRRALGDLWVLDLDDMAWAKPDTTGRPPAPRSAHVAAAHGGRYLLLFGGGSVATCFSDVHVLDTAAKPMQWSQPFVAGPTATPRAGHCGAVIGATWYVVGGGNNVHGVSDMLALDLRGLTAGAPLEWRVVASVDTRDPLSSEGAALVALPPDGGGDGSPTLLSFGGYNGKYHNTLSMMAAVEELPQLPAAAARAGEPAKGVALPATSMLHNEQPPPGAATAPTAQGAAKGAPASASGKATSVEEAVVEAATDMKSKLEAALKATEDAVRDAAAAKESASRELLALRGQLGEAITKAERAGKERDEAKAALTREREKAMKLEVEIAELRKKLGDAGELQKEVEALRRAVKEAETKKSSAGVWGYISGQ